MNSQTLKHNPLLPAILRYPVKMIPDAIHNHLVVKALNQLFRHELTEGELDFLEGRVLAVKVRDAAIHLQLSMRHRLIITPAKSARADLTMEGSFYDFLLLASRREDADTLFFNRRLKLSGDTELGLYVKNFLDALDLSQQRSYLFKLTEKMSRIAERLG
jgi:predicted lipid carrier protein YhbT